MPDIVPPSPVYTAFADSALWWLQRSYYERKGQDAWSEGMVPHYVSSHPAMARAYAQVVLGFWRDLKAQGMASTQPLYIVELGAGCGRFAYHFLLHFFDLFDAVRGPDDKVCYVMTDFSAVTIAQARQRLHARLGPFVAQGRLDFAVFDAGADSELELQHQQTRLSPGSLVLPPVIIANYVLGSLPQDLFFLNKERLYAGWVAIDTGGESDPDQPFASLTPLYQKRHITAPGYADSRWNRLIASYAERLPPCALLFPSHAIWLIERLAKLHGDNLLLLSADRGSHEAKALARQQEPEMARHGSFSLAVNYHALAELIRGQRGECWTSRAGDGLAILAACWRPPGGDRGSWRETAAAATIALQGVDPNDFYRIKQALETGAQHLSPEQMLAFLRLSQWDTKIFYLMYPHIYDFLAQLAEHAQDEWQQALTEVWRCHLPIGEDYDLAFDLGRLAAELNRWSAAIAWFSQSLDHLNPAQRQPQNRVGIYFNLGISHWQLAAYAKAQEWLLRALEVALPDESQSDYGNTGYSEDEEAEPDSHQQPRPTMREQLADLQVWHTRCRRLLGAETLQMPSSAPDERPHLYASLLGPHQAQALYKLQRDPELCRLAGVECLQNGAHAREWIEQEQRECQQVLAILHPDLGLVGVATLEYPVQASSPADERSGRFYYWIGQGHQNQGYGPAAMVLLHRLARSKGIHHLFSTVDQSNLASQRALAKLGYRQLSADPAGERLGYRHYYIGPATDAKELRAMLAGLLAALDSDNELASATEERHA
ncbi:GNAT family N-acetyltransferase [Oxalobacteraceae bacterium]|nr:GNAT family N-acetyltransferase [Oxalobacteraceae bacterium]